MSDPRDLLARYFQQRDAMGGFPMVLPEGKELEVAANDIPPTTHHAPRTTHDSRPSSDVPRWQKDAPPIPGPGITVAPPSKDLFSEDPLANASLAEIEKMVKSCTRCALHETRTHGVPGEGPADARLMVIGEGPGATEDELGRPFVGRAGKLLDEILAAIDCPRETVYITNIVKSRPPNNRKPETAEIEACLPYLWRQIDLIHPAVILAMGGTAAEALLGTHSALGALRNKVHNVRGIPLIVTYHPAALLRNPHWKRPTWDDVRIARQLLDR